MATMLILVSGVGLRFYVANIGQYDEVYGQLGAVIVLMLWLYVTALTVLIALEMNAVLARMAEEQKGIDLVQPESPVDDDR